MLIRRGNWRCRFALSEGWRVVMARVAQGGWFIFDTVLEGAEVNTMLQVTVFATLYLGRFVAITAAISSH